MWIGIILGVIALLIIGNWIYTTVNTKNVVEYYPNGRIKLKGVTKFNERVGSFDHFDEYGALSIKMTYENGKLINEKYYNTKNSKIWQIIEFKNGLIDKKIFLENSPYPIRNDKEIAIETIRLNGGFVLQYLSEELKNDRDVVMEALKKDSFALEYASEDLKKDKEIVKTAIEKRGLALWYASEELKNDRDIVLNAVKNNGIALGYASLELRKDKEIIITAIKSNGLALEFVSEEFKDQKEIVLMAVKRNGLALRFVKKSLLKYKDYWLNNDEEVIIEALNQNVEALKYVSYNFRNNYDFIFGICKDKTSKQFSSWICYASPNIYLDKKILELFQKKMDPDSFFQLIKRIWLLHNEKIKLKSKKSYFTYKLIFSIDQFREFYFPIISILLLKYYLFDLFEIQRGAKWFFSIVISLIYMRSIVGIVRGFNSIIFIKMVHRLKYDI